MPLVPFLRTHLLGLNQEDFGRTLKVIVAIGPDCAPLVPDLVRFLSDNSSYYPGGVIEALEAIGPAAAQAVPILADIMLGRRNRDCRESAADCLGGIQCPDTIPALAEAARDPDEWGPGVSAMRSLADFGPTAREYVPDLVEIFQTGTPGQRWEAAYALGRIGPPDGPGFRALADAYRQNNPDDGHQNLAENLLALGATPGELPPELCEIYVQMLSDDDDVIVRGACCAMLSRSFGTTLAVPVLMELACSNRHGEVRTAATSLLGDAAKLDATLIPRLVELLDSDDPDVRQMSALRLGELGPKAQQALPTLRRMKSQGMEKVYSCTIDQILAAISGQN